MKDDLAKCLNDAADLIEQRGGWVQQTWNIGSSFCMIGAVRAVCPRFMQAGEDEETELAHALGFYTLGRAIRWNDAPERTQEQVVARLRSGATGSVVGGLE